MEPYQIDPIKEDLYLITLDPSIPGFDNFISIWLYRSPRLTFLVDVGPSVCGESLQKALQDLRVKSLDYIFLTHIHIDHAGGLGRLAAAFPDTPIICHPKGISHLADPTRLQAGSLKTLGEIGKHYGPFSPVPKSQMMDADTFTSSEINVIATPGHAPHHLSFQMGEYLFAGEAGGVHFSLPSGPRYMRPATPPLFFLETTLASLDTLINLNPTSICYGHWGWKPRAVELLKAHRNQLELWKTIIFDEFQRTPADPRGEAFYTTCLNRLLVEDPYLAGWEALDETTRQREDYFIRNSLRGFEGYLQKIIQDDII